MSSDKSDDPLDGELIRELFARGIARGEARRRETGYYERLAASGGPVVKRSGRQKPVALTPEEFLAQLDEQEKRKAAGQ